MNSGMTPEKVTPDNPAQKTNITRGNAKVTCNIHLCIGLAEKDKSHLYDSVLLIDKVGKILLIEQLVFIFGKLGLVPAAAYPEKVI